MEWLQLTINSIALITAWVGLVTAQLVFRTQRKIIDQSSLENRKLETSDGRNENAKNTSTVKILGRVVRVSFLLSVMLVVGYWLYSSIDLDRHRPGNFEIAEIDRGAVYDLDSDTEYWFSDFEDVLTPVMEISVIEGAVASVYDKVENCRSGTLLLADVKRLPVRIYACGDAGAKIRLDSIRFEPKSEFADD